MSHRWIARARTDQRTRSARAILGIAIAATDPISSLFAGWVPGLAVLTHVELLGNGADVSCQDTVPFAVWCAARHFPDFVCGMKRCRTLIRRGRSHFRRFETGADGYKLAICVGKLRMNELKKELWQSRWAVLHGIQFGWR